MCLCEEETVTNKQTNKPTEDIQHCYELNYIQLQERPHVLISLLETHVSHLDFSLVSLKENHFLSQAPASHDGTKRLFPIRHHCEEQL